MTQRAEKDNDPASTETRRVADATGAGPRTWCARVWPPAPAARPAPAPRSRAEPSCRAALAAADTWDYLAESAVSQTEPNLKPIRIFIYM